MGLLFEWDQISASQENLLLAKCGMPFCAKCNLQHYLVSLTFPFYHALMFGDVPVGNLQDPRGKSQSPRGIPVDYSLTNAKARRGSGRLLLWQQRLYSSPLANLDDAIHEVKYRLTEMRTGQADLTN